MGTDAGVTDVVFATSRGLRMRGAARTITRRRYDILPRLNGALEPYMCVRADQ